MCWLLRVKYFILLWSFLYFAGNVGALIGSFDVLGRQSAFSLALSPNNQILFVGLMDGQVQKWNLSQAPPQYQQQLRYQEEEAQPTALTALNKDASLALIGNSHFLFTYFSISEFQLFVFNLLIFTI